MSFILVILRFSFLLLRAAVITDFKVHLKIRISNRGAPLINIYKSPFHIDFPSFNGPSLFNTITSKLEEEVGKNVAVHANWLKSMSGLELRLLYQRSTYKKKKFLIDITNKTSEKNSKQHFKLLHRMPVNLVERDRLIHLWKPQKLSQMEVKEQDHIKRLIEIGSMPFFSSYMPLNLNAMNRSFWDLDFAIACYLNSLVYQLQLQYNSESDPNIRHVILTKIETIRFKGTDSSESDIVDSLKFVTPAKVRDCSPIDGTTTAAEIEKPKIKPVDSVAAYTEDNACPNDEIQHRVATLEELYQKGIILNNELKKFPNLLISDTFLYHQCHENEVAKLSKDQMNSLVKNMEAELTRLEGRIKFLKDDADSAEQAGKSENTHSMKNSQECTQTNTESAKTVDTELQVSNSEIVSGDWDDKLIEELMSSSSVSAEKRMTLVLNLLNKGKCMERWLIDAGVHRYFDIMPYRKCYFDTISEVSTEKYLKIVEKMKSSIETLLARIEEVTEELKRKCQETPLNKCAMEFLNHIEGLDCYQISPICFRAANSSM